jgi:Holliday junction resolvasome RuvABC endonuclease subunit
MIYVGIDFSLNSPAFCVLKNKKFFWGSLTRSDRSEDSLKKSKDKPFSILSDAKDFGLYYMKKNQMPEEYSERERIKIDYFQELVDSFWNEIEKHLDDSSEIIFAIEGLSFASNGNALIDISMATALMRKKIVDRIGSQNFYVFSPTSIKKFAKKGNAKKDELYQSIIEKVVPETNFSSLTKILSDHKDQWITKSGVVNKPLDDIIDASWICLYLMYEVKKDES